MIRTQQYIKLITGAKEAQQLNPGGTDNSQNIRRQPSHLNLDKFLSQNCQRSEI